jgi:hypothetical protein
MVLHLSLRRYRMVLHLSLRRYRMVLRLLRYRMGLSH